MLEVLPPENWHHRGSFEFFQMCEYYYFDRTTYYVRDGRNIIPSSVSRL